MSFETLTPSSESLEKMNYFGGPSAKRNLRLELLELTKVLIKDDDRKNYCYYFTCITVREKTLNELLSGAGLVYRGELRSAKHFMKEIFQVLLHRVAAAD